MGKRFDWILIAAGTLLAVAAGCDSQHLIGSVDGGGTPGSPDGSGNGLPVDGLGGRSAVATGGSPGGGDGTGGARMVGPLGPSQTWSGYVENYQFFSGSDAVVLTFASDADGLVAGTIVLGNGQPPPPATDPDADYPPEPIANLFPGMHFFGTPFEGFTYTMQNGLLTTGRLRFALSTNELWAGWCALQTPASDGSGSCLPNWGGMSGPSGCSQTNPANGQVVQVSCAKFMLCAGTRICQCDMSSCGANLNPDWEFDIALGGDQGNGSIRGVGNVRLIKQP